MHIIDELSWRGLIQDIMPGTKEQLSKEQTTCYVGFDPTAASLHIGSLVPILLLLHLQKAGHKPLALVGGATGMVGDPSGKSEERKLLDEETLNKNLQGIKNQLSKYLDFDTTQKNYAEIVNNYDWFKNFSFLNFIRDVGKHITVNYMMSKDSVKKRLEGEQGMSFTEFTYQLVQGYDFYYLYTQHHCKLQMGGSDQWGNIVTGTELIRRKAAGEAFAFTAPLLTKADGGKFGKSEKGNVWLDINLTSAYDFYQFWINVTDDDAKRFIKIFTFLDQQTIEALISEHEMATEKRILQKRLAAELTLFVHGKEQLDIALQTTENIFSGALTLDVINNLEGVTKVNIDKAILHAGIDIVSFLADTKIFASKGEARKAVQGGGISINREKITDVNTRITETTIVFDKYILTQHGKKKYYLIELN
jgi:tyrosyl-tRNA synthetase